MEIKDINEKLESYLKEDAEINEDEFSDRVDADFDISLYEYGVVRNPDDDMTLIGTKPGDDGLYTDYQVTYISLDDVQKTIEDMEDGFFETIDQSREDVLDTLNNEHIAPYIQYINNYNGYFMPNFYESVNEEEVKVDEKVLEKRKLLDEVCKKEDVITKAIFGETGCLIDFEGLKMIKADVVIYNDGRILFRFDSTYPGRLDKEEITTLFEDINKFQRIINSL